MLQRPRFFTGQILTAKDFEDEQQYQIQKRRLYNRAVHGCGVVAGLAVEPDATGGDQVSISPGFAIDGLGNEIGVEEPQFASLNCTDDACFVVLRYTETLADAVPVPSGEVEYTRVVEGFAVDTSAEEPALDSGAVLLARLVRSGGRWHVDSAPGAGMATA